MRSITHSHCGGDKALPAKLRREVEDAITAITVKAASGMVAKLRNQFLDSLRAAGWSGEVMVSPNSAMTITSQKNKIGLCLQAGNFARVHSDLLKLQALYLNAAIEAAIIVVPSKETASRLGSNLAQCTRLLQELETFKKVITVPTVIFSMESL